MWKYGGTLVLCTVAEECIGSGQKGLMHAKVLLRFNT